MLHAQVQERENSVAIFRGRGIFGWISVWKIIFRPTHVYMLGYVWPPIMILVPIIIKKHWLLRDGPPQESKMLRWCYCLDFFYS